MNNLIRSHPPGEKITDADMVEELSTHMPAAFKQAQRVLVATEKYHKKAGLFSTERSRLQRLQSM
ncbi:MAG: hypothetical protein RBT51_11310 [Ectothiorhodospiraceae bacterium]|nr:hypothetical protein [Ectothiorhodospiraceae bacterium]